MKKLKSLIACFVSFFILFSSIHVNARLADTQQCLTNYKISLNFDDSKKTITASETVKFTNTYDDNLKDIVFHLYPDSYNKTETMPAFSVPPDAKLNPENFGDIDIEKVSIGGKNVYFTEDNQILKLTLETPLKKNDTIEISIEFLLKIPCGSSRLGYIDNIYSITNWYPILSIYDSSDDKWDENKFNPNGESNYSDVSNYDVIVNVPEGYIIASTGVVKSDEKKDKIETYDIAAEKVRDFVFTLSKDYKVLTKTVDGVKVNSFYTDPDTKDAAQKSLDVAADSMQFFSKTFGKYPYPELDVVETYLSGGAMEYPQLIQLWKYGRNIYDNGTEVPFSVEAVAHETCHQWWYVLAGNNEFKEPLMDESLTVYSTAYYFEKKYGKYCTAGTFMKVKSNYYPSPEPFNLSVDKYKDYSEYIFNVYNRAPIIFEVLRTEAGEDNFIKILRTYFERFEYKNGSIEELLNVIGEISGDKVKDDIKTAITKPNYLPDNIQITDEERQQASKIQMINSFKNMEKTEGFSLSSFILRALEDGVIYIVKPDDLNNDDNKNCDSFIEQLKDEFKNNYGIKVVIKSPVQLTASEKKGNLLLLGNMNNNKVMYEMKDNYPLEITPRGIIMDDLSFISNNSSGVFAVKNPENENKAVLVYFWQHNFRDYPIIYPGSDQFIININDKMKISGKF